MLMLTCLCLTGAVQGPWLAHIASCAHLSPAHGSSRACAQDERVARPLPGSFAFGHGRSKFFFTTLTVSGS